ncbi:olfactory receptor 6B1-like [Leptodactylus fuscus]|uniref:olfactory receptor 6B1-like n=1 Tax=Leptodactylus fuscus TaxID=238119 RepID=UPI003F4F2140
MVKNGNKPSAVSNNNTQLQSEGSGSKNLQVEQMEEHRTPGTTMHCVNDALSLQNVIQETVLDTARIEVPPYRKLKPVQMVCLMANDSTTFYFVIVGFSGLQEKFYPVFGVLMFFIYDVSLCANTTVIVIVLLKKHLHQPMYIIIANLALSDLFFDTMTLPKVISKYWFGSESISFSACFLQMAFVHTLNCLDSLTLLLMAFDRYVAICRPLRYHAIISNRVSMFLCVAAWFAAAFVGIYVMTWGIFFPYCGPNRIKSFYCSLSPVTVNTCIDSSAARRNGLYAGLIMHMGPFSAIVVSYIVIILNICSMSHLENWQKALNTCITHWFVLIIFYIPRIVDYGYNAQVVPNADVATLMICIYSYVPHICSPIIFCLRNKEIKRTLGNMCKQIVSP